MYYRGGLFTPRLDHFPIWDFFLSPSPTPFHCTLPFFVRLHSDVGGLSDVRGYFYANTNPWNPSSTWGCEEEKKEEKILFFYSYVDDTIWKHRYLPFTYPYFSPIPNFTLQLIWLSSSTTELIPQKCDYDSFLPNKAINQTALMVIKTAQIQWVSRNSWVGRWVMTCRPNYCSNTLIAVYCCSSENIDALWCYSSIEIDNSWDW